MSADKKIKKVRGQFICPITQELMRDPVNTPAGIMYDRCAIEQWLNSGHSTDPYAGTPLSINELRTCHNDQQTIEELYGDEMKTIPNQTGLEKNLKILEKIKPINLRFIYHIFCSLNSLNRKKIISLVVFIDKNNNDKEYKRYQLNQEYQYLIPQFNLFKQNLFAWPPSLINSLLFASIGDIEGKVLKRLEVKFSSDEQVILFDKNELENEVVLEALCDIISTGKDRNVNTIIELGKSVIHSNTSHLDTMPSVYDIAKIQPDSLRNLIIKQSSDIAGHLVDDDNYHKFNMFELLNVNTDVLAVLLDDDNPDEFSFACRNLNLSMREFINNTIPPTKQISLVENCALINRAFKLENRSQLDDEYSEKFISIATKNSGEDRINQLIRYCNYYQQEINISQHTYVHKREKNNYRHNQRHQLPHDHIDSANNRFLVSKHPDRCCLHVTWKNVISIGCMCFGAGLGIYYGYKTGESLFSHTGINDTDALLSIIGALTFIIGLVVLCCYKSNYTNQNNNLIEDNQSSSNLYIAVALLHNPLNHKIL